MKKIKSVGYSHEEGIVLDDSAGNSEEVCLDMFELEGEQVASFEEGFKSLVDELEESPHDIEKDDIEEIKFLLRDLKDKAPANVQWVRWGVEYDTNLGYLVEE